MCSLILSAFLFFSSIIIPNVFGPNLASLLLLCFIVKLRTVTIYCSLSWLLLISSFSSSLPRCSLCLYSSERNAIFCLNIFVFTCTFMLSAFLCFAMTLNLFWLAPKWSRLFFLHWAKIVFFCELWFRFLFCSTKSKMAKQLLERHEIKMELRVVFFFLVWVCYFSGEVISFRLLCCVPQLSLLSISLILRLESELRVFFVFFFIHSLFCFT